MDLDPSKNPSILDGWMDKKIHFFHMDGWMDPSNQKSMDGWMDKKKKKKDGWLDGWMDKKI